MNVSIEVIEILFTNHSFIIYLFIYLFIYFSFIYLFIYFSWHLSGTQVRTCVQVATPLNIKAFAMMDMSINKASRKQFVTGKVSMMSPRLMSSKTSAQLDEDFRIWIACVFCSSGKTTHQCGRPTYSN